jgi:hypothetical protein
VIHLFTYSPLIIIKMPNQKPIIKSLNVVSWCGIRWSCWSLNCLIFLFCKSYFVKEWYSYWEFKTNHFFPYGSQKTKPMLKMSTFLYFSSKVLVTISITIMSWLHSSWLECKFTINPLKLRFCMTCFKF